MQQNNTTDEHRFNADKCEYFYQRQSVLYPRQSAGTKPPNKIKILNPKNYKQIFSLLPTFPLPVSGHSTSLF
jgi:hypothetical protein